MTNGTPKTLLEAITNGIEEAMTAKQSYDGTLDVITAHVRDFLSQKFGTEMIKADRMVCTQEVLNRLWNQITGEKLK